MSDDYLTKGGVQTPSVLFEKPKVQPRQEAKKDDLFLEGYGRQWGEKTTYSMGMSYGLCLASGGLFGGLQGMSKGGSTPKLFINSVMNGATSSGIKLANQGAIMTMYYVLGNQFLGWIRAEDDMINAPVAGAFSGFLYKVTSKNWPLTARYAGAAALVFTGLDQIVKKGII